jgi:SAM-dependent methyltransferase
MAVIALVVLAKKEAPNSPHSRQIMPSPIAPICRTCGSPQTALVGRSPRARWFAGARLHTQLHGGALFRCARCDLLQRHPILSETEYVKLYEASGDHWPQPTLRPDQLKVRNYILKALPNGGRVLDIGCAAGALLLSLGDGYEKFGVEPAAESAAKAASEGVTIVADSVGMLAHQSHAFDLICAVDVIEHVADPLSLLHQLLTHLKSDGEIVVSTGNSETAIWRWVGPSYYYSHYFEHISFISPRWCAFVQSKGIDHTIIEANFCHEISGQRQPNLGAWLKFTFKLALTWVEKNLVMRFPGTTKQLGPRLSVGEPGLFADHLLVAFREKSAGKPTKL